MSTTLSKLLSLIGRVPIRQLFVVLVLIQGRECGKGL